MWLDCNPLPSAANLLSKGTVYPLAFFQFETHGGIFHSFCSFTLTLRVGECITGAGGEGGPRGIFLFILRNKYTELGPVCNEIKRE